MPADVVFKILPVIVTPVVPESNMVHVIVLFVALDGLTPAERNNDTPAIAVVGTPVIFVTGICAEFTVILKF